MATLIYKTTDGNFANSCIQALEEAGVAAFRTGDPLPGGTDFTISIYIHDLSQSKEANEVLLKLGAVMDAEPTLPSRPVMILLVAATLLLAVIVATWGHKF